jgi:translation initiation factor 1
MAKNKRTSGDGWSFEPADREEETPQTTESLAPEQQRLRARTEKRNKGKLVTVVGPFVLTPDDLAKLAKELKKTCGTGGSVQGDNIELQGDCVPRAKTWLEGRGYSVRG